MIDLAPAILAIKEKIFRLQYAQRTLEELQDQTDSPIEAPVNPPVSLSEKRMILDQPLGAAANCRRGGKKDAVLDYVRAHPGCTSAAIARDLKVADSNAKYNLGLLIKEKEVTKKRDGLQTFWTAKGATEKEAPPLPEVAADKPHKCDICGKRFIVKGSLLSHMRIDHASALI